MQQFAAFPARPLSVQITWINVDLIGAPMTKLSVTDYEDLGVRWSQARISAIRKAFGDNSPNDINNHELHLLDFFLTTSSKAAHFEYEKKKHTLLRGVFDHSRRLALSFSKKFGLTFELDDFQDFLKTSKIPCSNGDWESRHSARILSRHSCSCGPISNAGTDVCDYWREAIDGFVMGLGERERFVRHSCIKRGDTTCVDVFYLDSEYEALAWRPIPPEMAADLIQICKEFEKQMSVPILLKGIRESVLYFEFLNSRLNGCGGSQFLLTLFQRKINSKYPDLQIHDVTPKPVLGEKK